MIIDCKQIKQDKIKEIKDKVDSLSLIPKLIIISDVGYDSASEVYIKNKIKTLNECGIDSEVINLNDISYNTKEEYLSNIKTVINISNKDSCVNGIIVQLPLKYGVTEKDFADDIDWTKDVDGFSSINRGRLMNGLDCLIPCTALGVMSTLPKDLSGKDVIVINRSGLVGLPLYKLLLDRNATVMTCHSKTRFINDNISFADIIITAVGKSNFINVDCVNINSTIIDVAITRDESGKLCGDIPKDKYDYLNKIRANYTTVPNGIGLLTCASLANNIVKACTFQGLS